MGLRLLTYLSLKPEALVSGVRERQTGSPVAPTSLASSWLWFFSSSLHHDFHPPHCLHCHHKQPLHVVVYFKDTEFFLNELQNFSFPPPNYLSSFELWDLTTQFNLWWDTLEHWNEIAWVDWGKKLASSYLLKQKTRAPWFLLFVLENRTSASEHTCAEFQNESMAAVARVAIRQLKLNSTYWGRLQNSSGLTFHTRPS